MRHRTKRQNNGMTELDTTIMKLAFRESAKRRQCPNCERRGAMVKVADLVGYHARRCRYCGYVVEYGEKV